MTTTKTLATDHQGPTPGLACTAALFAGIIAFTLAASPADAKTYDGVTPAVETICDDAGFSRALRGLCNAYCEAMDCDVRDDGHKGCQRVLNNFVKKSRGTAVPPCLLEEADEEPEVIEETPAPPSECPCWSADELAYAVDKCADSGFQGESGVDFGWVVCDDGSFYAEVWQNEVGELVCTKETPEGTVERYLDPDEVGYCLAPIQQTAPLVG